MLRAETPGMSEPNLPTVPLRPEALELHLESDADFTRKGWGALVKKHGGHFNHCRGYSEVRYVHVPLTEHTEQLVRDLHRLFGRKAHRGDGWCAVWIARNHGDNGIPAWVTVQHVPVDGDDDPLEYFLVQYHKAIDNARKRGLCEVRS